MTVTLQGENTFDYTFLGFDVAISSSIFSEIVLLRLRRLDCMTSAFVVVGFLRTSSDPRTSLSPSSHSQAPSGVAIWSFRIFAFFHDASHFCSEALRVFSSGSSETDDPPLRIIHVETTHLHTFA